jgi:hypothetical protein
MLKLPRVGDSSRAVQEWGVTVILAQIREYRAQAIVEEERCLEAMLHWRDPIERHRPHRHRRRTLVDDNPASG